MPIEARTPKECFDAFRDHVAELLANTVSRRYLLRSVAVEDAPERRRLSFWQQDRAIAIPIVTDIGRLHFFCSQVLGVVEHGRHYRLRTLAYAYRLQLGPDSDARALLRWEFISGIGRSRGFHVHADSRIEDSALSEALDLDKLHVATGRVLVEDVVRFLVAELGHKPPCGVRRCELLLDDSVRRFYEEFSTPGA